MNHRHLVRGSLVVVAAFVGCNVYDSSLLTGEGGTETGGEGGSVAPGGSSAGGGAPSGGSGGSGGSSGGGVQGGTAGTGGNVPPEGGAGGEDPGTGGSTTGGTDAGGSAGSAGDAGAGGVAGATGGAAGGGAGGAGAGDAGNGGIAGAGAGGASGAGAGGGGAGGGPIVQLSGTASADSEQASPAHPATHGNDGMTSTRWCAANSATGHYWTLDLGAVRALARFEVIWEYPSQAVGLPYGYLVSVSNDGATFTPSIDRQTTTDTMQIQTSDFPPSASGRYVRITATSLPQGAWASFWEVRVFGQ